MTKTRSIKKQIAKYTALAVIFFIIVFFLLRGPYLSNYIKRLIIPQLENITRERVLIEKAVINLLPFYIQAKGFKIFDRNGNRLLWITKARTYIDLSGLFSREIRVRRLTLHEPELTATDEDIKRILNTIKQSSTVGRGGRFKVRLNSIRLTGGKIKYGGGERIEHVSGSGLFLNVSSKNMTFLIDMTMEKGRFKVTGYEGVNARLDGKARVKGDNVEISSMNISSDTSTLSANGRITMSPQGGIKEGDLTVRSKIYTSLLRSFFDVDNEKDGFVSFDGTVHMTEGVKSKWPQFFVDLETDSKFYLETLMDILKVNENIRGSLTLKGRISGTYPDIQGRGSVRLDNAQFGTLPLEDLSGRITYEKGKFTLSDFRAKTYGGEMNGDAHISIPHGDYMVDARVSHVNSRKFFTFIKWEPPFQEGEIHGNFHLEHRHKKKIMVTADVNYINNQTVPGNDIASRIKKASTTLELKNNILSLANAVLSTEKTQLFLDGMIALDAKNMNLNLELLSRDVSDLTIPHYTALTAPVRFMGLARGPLNNPVMSGKAEFKSGKIHEIEFDNASASLTYRISGLDVEKLLIDKNESKYDISGSISFRKSKKLFSFKDPYFTVEASFKNVPVEQFVKVLYKSIPVSSKGSGEIFFEGDINSYRGSTRLHMVNSDIYGQSIDTIDVRASFDPSGFVFEDLDAQQRDAVLRGSGRLLFNEQFQMNASIDHMRLQDIDVLGQYPFDALSRINIEGSGTLKSPDITFSIDILESSVNSSDMGKGVINGKVQKRKIIADGNLADGLISLTFHSTGPKLHPWSLKMKFHDGAYDFLAAGFIKNIPSDLSIWGEGLLTVESEDDGLHMSSEISSLNIDMYEYALRNKGNIYMDYDDDTLTLKSFAFDGKDGSLSATGNVTIGKNYDLSVEGELNVAPLKAFSDQILTLEGRSSFNVDIKGLWEDPEVMGAVRIDNVSTLLSPLKQKLGPISGSVTLNREKFAFDSVRAEFAGGHMILSGIGHVKKLSLDTLNISSTLHGIQLRHVEGIKAKIGGELYYELTSESSRLTGNISFKDGKYERRVDWKKWIPGLKVSGINAFHYPDFIKKTELNIQITGSDHFRIDNNIAKAPVHVDLNVSGTIERLGLFGRIESDEGNVYFRGNEFRILEGSSVDFLDSSRIQPLFHIVAETYRSDHYIRLALDGTIDNFTLALFSDPPLPESDILTLLTFGQLNQGSQGFESEIAAGEATSLLTGPLQEDIVEEMKGITTIERFAVHPHLTSRGALTSKVTVGKRVLEDKVSVIYSTAIGTTEEQFIEVEYKLNKEVSLIGSRNELGSAGADIKYRFEFK